MAGFFRRLAEHARQPLPALRPARARLFAPQPARDMSPTELSDSPESSEDGGAELRSASIEIADDTLHAARLQTVAVTVEAPEREHSVPPPNAEQAVESGLQLTDRAAPAGDSVQRVSVERPAAPTRAPRLAANAQRGSASGSSPAHSEPARRASHGAETAMARTRGAPIAGKPAPGMRRLPESAAGKARIRAEAIPDVHIHIGRVELTAVAPAERNRRTPAPDKKPMSLDEYLDRRRKGAP